jgi:hypothetical protein
MTAGAPPVDYFAELCQGLHATPDRKGEVWVPCPQCGKKGNHFSFSQRGAKCFVCGYRPPLAKLFEALVGGAPVTAAPRPAARPAPPKPWQRRALDLARGFAQTPGTVEAWQRYKPLPADVVAEHVLGLGIFPGGLYDEKHQVRCTHRRLIVPLFSDGDVTGFRCRAIECGCTRWLSPGGSKLTLYNAGAIRMGEALTIVENPIDALLVGAAWDQAAVATLGVSIWNDGYTGVLQLTQPSLVCVAFDNDAPGNATDPAILAAWRTAHPRVPPPQNGLRLVNRLLQAGFRAFPFDWTGYRAGADIGELITC